MDISNLGDIIRWPFEMLGKSLNFIFSWWLEIGIIIGALYVLYFIFSRGIIGRIVEWMNTPNEEVKIDNLKGGIEENV